MSPENAYEAGWIFRPGLTWVSGLLALLTFCAPTNGQGLSDPVQIKRVVVPLSTIPAELERVRSGALVQMPKEEFDALFDRATRKRSDTVRLVTAKYTAELAGNALRGKGLWTISAAAPGVLPLAELNLALESWRWNSDAEPILGSLHETGLGLYVTKGGEFSFDWSLRGSAEPGGLSFNPRLPPCAVSLLEVTAPAEQELIVAKSAVLMDGPIPAPQAGKQLWRIQFSGRADVSFQVRRRAPSGGGAPAIVAKLQTRQSVTPDRITAEYAFQIDATQNALRELAFDCDPGLVPLEVSASNAELRDWEFKDVTQAADTVANSQKTSTLIVHLREAHAGALGLRLRFMAKRALDESWTSPAVRVRRVLSRGEALRLDVHPDVHLERFDVGGFRLVSSTTDEAGAQVLSLVDPAVGHVTANRPRARFRTDGFEALTRQSSWWRIGAAGSTFEAEIAYELVRGGLMRLRLQLPEGKNWRVEEVKTQPPDAIRSWEDSGAILTVHLRQNVGPGSPIKLLARLSATYPATTQGPSHLEMPSLQPLDSAQSQTSLAISADSNMQTRIENSTVPPAPLASAGPWAADWVSPALAPHYYFESRGQRITGQVTVFPRPATLAPANVSPPPRLDMSSGAAWCDFSNLESYVDGSGQLLHQFRFAVCNWQKRELMVELPQNALKVFAARIDGRWLDDVASDAGAAGKQVALPVPGDRGRHVFDVFYATPAAWSSWSLVAELAAPRPKLPMSAVISRRTWRLAPELLPAHDGQVRGGSSGISAMKDWRRLWHMADEFGAEFIPQLADEGDSQQAQVFLSAEAAMRRKLTRDVTLGEALSKLSHEFLRDQSPVVMDGVAFQSAGLTPESPLLPLFASAGGTAHPFWEALGLVYVPFPSGPVLTTRRQLTSWQQAYGSDAELRHDCGAAVAEAIAHGHDSAGRFVTLTHWLCGDHDFTPRPQSSFLPDTSGWTVWQPRAGMPDSDTLLVVNAGSARSRGLITGVLTLGLACWLGLRLSRTWCYRLWIIALAGLVVMLLWLPESFRPVLWGSFAALAACLAGWFSRNLMRPVLVRSPKPSTVVKGAVAGSVVGLAMLASPRPPALWSQGQEPFSVLLVEPQAGKQMALVSPDLLRRLTELEKSSVPSGAMLVSAQYQGQMREAHAEFKARFEIHSFSDKAEFAVPLSGVELQETCLLDGAPAFPTALPAPAVGYVVDVAGKGRHQLELSFTVRPAMAGGFQEVRFSGPPLCKNLLEWRLAKSAQAFTVNGLGAEEIREAPDGAAVLTASRGRAGAVALRWRLQNAPAAASAIDVREAYWWDLRGGNVSLTGALEFSPLKGALNRLAVTIPESIDIVSVDLALAGVPTTSTGGALLENWHVEETESGRQLLVELTRPVDRPVLARLSLLPRLRVSPGNVLLPLPLPTVGRLVESFMAYRLEGVEAVPRAQNMAVTSVGADVFAKVWSSLGQKDAIAASRAFGFRRAAKEAGLALVATSPKVTAQGEVTWQVSRRHADFRADLRLSSVGGISLVEADLPTSVVLAQVLGESVQRWSRGGTRVQIWLAEPQKQVSLELLGWAPLDLEVSATAGRLVTPPITFLGLQPEQLPSKVIAGRDLALTPEEPRLGKHKDQQTFALDDSSQKAAFQARLRPPRADVAVLTTVNERAAAWLVTSLFQMHAPLGNPGPIRVLLRDCPVDDVRLEFSEAVPRLTRLDAGAEQAWELDFPAGTPYPITFQLHSRIPVRDQAPFRVPDIIVQGAGSIVRLLAVSGDGLRPDTLQGLKKVRDAALELSRWPWSAGVMNQLGLWRIVEPSWRLTLVNQAPNDAPARVFLANEWASLADGLRWVHHGEFLLGVRGAADLRLGLPEDAQVIALTVDDQPRQPRRRATGALEIHPVEATGAHVVRLCWQYPSESESLLQPRLGGMRWEGAKSAPLVAQVLASPGYASADPPGGSELGEFERHLVGARAQLDLTQFLADVSAPQAASVASAARREWLSSLRQAEMQISYFATDEDKAQATKAVAQLRKEGDKIFTANVVDSAHEPSGRTAAQTARPLAASASMAGQGMLFSWRLPAGQSSVVTLAADEPGLALGYWTALAILAAMLALVPSWVPRGLDYLAALAPELLAIFALLGFWTLGLSVIAVLLFLLGAGARLVWILRELHLRASVKPESAKE